VPSDDRPFAMALCALPGIGAVRARRLRSHFGSYAKAWQAGADRLEAARCVPQSQLAAVLDARCQAVSPHQLPGLLSRHGTSAVFAGDPQYPALLASLHDAPPVVYIRGGLEAGDSLAVALVGTRRMSAYGRHMAARLAGALAGAGLVVISGLARGIDAVAHQAAIDGGGRTIAVLAGGLDSVYPPEHRDLAERVAGQGALISEYLPGTPTVSGNFPARNRLIAGASLATVVIEAGARSGALLTAGFAVEQGREVFAVPGRVGDPNSAGVHALLEDGAGLVESAGDVLAGLPDWATRAAARVRTAASAPEPEPDPDLDAETVTSSGASSTSHIGGDISSMVEVQRRILQIVEGGPRREQELIDASAAVPGLARAALVRLEMQGLICRLPGAIFTSGTHGR
jgi:DNA processing protein